MWDSSGPNRLFKAVGDDEEHLIHVFPPVVLLVPTEDLNDGKLLSIAGGEWRRLSAIRLSNSNATEEGRRQRKNMAMLSMTYKFETACILSKGLPMMY